MFKPPVQITEQAVLPLGLPWGGKVYTLATMRAEMLGDQEAVLDAILTADPSRLDLEADSIHIGALELATAKRLHRITEIATADEQDKLTGAELRQALDNGLYPADGTALFEADQRLEKKLPTEPESSESNSSLKSDSADSAIEEKTLIE